MKVLFMNSFKYLLKFIRIIVTILILLTLILIIAQLFGTSMESTPAFDTISRYIKGIDNFFTDYIKVIIPHTFYGRDFSYVILFIVFLIVNSIIYRLIDAIELRLKKQGHTPEYVGPKTEALPDSSQVKKPKNRKEMLTEFVSLKNRLDKMGQECAFLSVDVVNSTGMKAGEDKLVAMHDFDRYNELAKGCLYEHGVIKFTTTPDGIMACFRTVDDAVKAAVLLMDKLKIFNEKSKQIATDFQVRCGINSGFVYIEGLPLEQVSDHVIDVAGHMQKHAKPNTINIAGSAIEPLKTRGGFRETTDVIDEQRVYVWQKNQAAQDAKE